MEAHVTDVALDSCVVIRMLDRPGSCAGIRAGLRGKRARIVLCGTVLREVARVRGVGAAAAAAAVARALGREVRLVEEEACHREAAAETTRRLRPCHRGDSLIVALCQARDYVLVTYDRMLLEACGWVGVAAFHPSGAGGI